MGGEIGNCGNRDIMIYLAKEKRAVPWTGTDGVPKA